MLFWTEAPTVEMKFTSFFHINFSTFLIWYLGVWKCQVELQTWLDLILISNDVKVELGYMLMTI